MQGGPKAGRKRLSKKSPEKNSGQSIIKTEARNLTMDDSLKKSCMIVSDLNSKWTFDKKDPDVVKKNVSSFMSNVAQGIKPFRREFRIVRGVVPEGTKDAFVGNEVRNRYPDILLLDATRVKIKDYENDYIHASRVTVGEHTFVCAQGPMTNTVVAFWRMVAQENVKLIVMLCRLMEEGKEKSFDYFPHNVGDKKEFEGMTVVCTKKEPTVKGITSSTLQFTYKKKTKTLDHLAFDDWPDHSAPASLDTSLALMKMAREKCGNQPILVHCSAGVGRTGCFVGLELARHLAATTSSFNMETAIKTLRSQRMQSIQCDVQYLYVCRGLLECLKQRGIIKKSSFSRFAAEYEEYMKRKTGKGTCDTQESVDFGPAVEPSA